MSENNFQFVCGTDQVPEVQSRAFSIAAGRASKIEIAFFNLEGAF